MPLNPNISGHTKQIKDKETKYLTEDQAKHIYKKVEPGSIINIDTIKQEMDQDFDRLDDTSGDINPYQEIIVNKVERDNTILLQTEQWSVLCNLVNNIQYDRQLKNFCNLDVKAVDQKSHK